MVQVKICGINSPAAADAAVSGGADYAGLVFFSGSPRQVMPEQAASVAARLRGRCRIMAVVVDAADPDIERAVQAVRPDFIQLHGRETPERIAAIRHRFGIPVVKAIAVGEAGDLVRASEYEAVADMLLFDTKTAEHTRRPGGHGVPFDWQLLHGRKFVRPWLLAGGLTAENVARAIRACGAPGVDCSSGVETSRGAKNPQLIREFIAAARTAQFAGTDA
jgi:phosphoribosylanthranilate isomerase